MKITKLNYQELRQINGGCSNGKVGHMLGACWAKFLNWLDNRSAYKMIETIDSNGGAIAGTSA